jgi:hypothetical protein
VTLLPGRLVDNSIFHVRSITFTSTLQYRALLVVPEKWNNSQPSAILVARVEEAACSFNTDGNMGFEFAKQALEDMNSRIRVYL